MGEVVSDMVAYAINAILCSVLAVVMAPMSKDLLDHGAPVWVAGIPLAIGGLALICSLFFAYKTVKAGIR
jgi:hypothetical protein